MQAVVAHVLLLLQSPPFSRMVKIRYAFVMSDDRPRNAVVGKHFGKIFATERAPKSHVVVRHLEMYGAKSVLGLSTRLPLFHG